MLVALAYWQHLTTHTNTVQWTSKNPFDISKHNQKASIYIKLQIMRPTVIFEKKNKAFKYAS